MKKETKHKIKYDCGTAFKECQPHPTKGQWPKSNTAQNYLGKKLKFFFFLRFIYLFIYFNAFIWTGQWSVMTGSEAEKRWGEDRETTAGQTEPVSPRAMKPVNGGLISLRHSDPLRILNSSRNPYFPPCNDNLYSPFTLFDGKCDIVTWFNTCHP